MDVVSPIKNDPLATPKNNASVERESGTPRHVLRSRSFVSKIPVSDGHFFVKKRRTSFPIIYEYVCAAPHKCKYGGTGGDLGVHHPT